MGINRASMARKSSRPPVARKRQAAQPKRRSGDPGTEPKEALEQQAAVSGILRAMSRAQTDVVPVLETIAEHAMRLCRARDARIWLLEGDRIRYVTGCGDIPPASEGHTVPVNRGSGMGRAIVDGKPVHIKDAAKVSRDEFPIVREMQRLHGQRTTLSVPLVRENRALGAIILRKMVVEPFTKRQIALVQTFADQAVIVIENVRLFNETKAALEQQTATGEILKVISSSPTDIQPVFDAIAENATRLCDASDVVIRRVEGDVARVVAHFGPVPMLRPEIRISRGSIAGRSILERRTLYIDDILEPQVLEDYPDGASRVQQGVFHRTVLAVPLLRGKSAIGTIVIRRPDVRPFSDKEIKLLESFAAQAVIAIENVRLFNETKEALEQQTVISEILSVMSSSPTDTQPVFDAIVKSGARLFPGMTVGLRLVKGDYIETVASTVPTGGTFPVPLHDESLPSPRAIMRREVVQIPDILTAEEWVNPRIPRERAQKRGWRAIVMAPMLRGDRAVGLISVWRPTPGPFTDKQIALLKTFADQAVIAIENVRLFNETKEALEQQTATAEILRVISSSPTDIQPVFDAIVRNAVRLCGGEHSVAARFDGEQLHALAFHGFSPGAMHVAARMFPMRPGMQNLTGRAVLQRDVVVIPDMLADPDYSHEFAMAGGWRSGFAVPMVRDGEIIGVIAVSRTTLGAFSEHQIELLKIFADQAVIAIENVRLFHEIKEALQ